MTRHLAEGRTDRTTLDLVAIARHDLDQIEAQVRWRTADLDGQRRTGDSAGRSGPSDPTHAARSAADQSRRALRRAQAQLAALVDRRLPAILAALELDHADPRYSEKPLLRDDNTGDRHHLGPATLDGGLSAYRGDVKTPRGRPDLAEALAAQHRRNRRGESHGHG
jgi:hypothetical protein